jgi:methyl-accepting chemotaxis protein
MRYKFDNSFFTGCEFVDDQHGQLFDAINALLDACEQHKGHEELQKSLDFLAQYTINHFFDEEQILKKYHYSDFYKHHQYHETFTKAVRDFSDQFAIQGSSDILIAEVQKKIGNWLTEHIKGQDFHWTLELKEKAPELFTGTNAADKLREMVSAPQKEKSSPWLSGSASEKRQPGILIKIAGLSSILIFIAIAILTSVSMFYIRDLSFRTAVTIIESKLKGDLSTLSRRITEEYGILSLQNGSLYDERGRPLNVHPDVVNEVARDLDIAVSIFEYSDAGFRQVATTIVDASGKSALGALMTNDNPALSSLLAGQPFTGELIILGKLFVGSYVPVFAQGSNNVIGALFVGVEMSMVQGIIGSSVKHLLLFIILGALTLLVVTVLLNFSLIKILLITPVRKIINVLQKAEEGDISQQIQMRSGDEIGDMASSFDKTMDSLKRLVMIIRNEAEAVDDISDDLAANMGRTADAVNEINGGIQRVQQEVTHQNESVTATNAAMERITENITKLNDKIEVQSTSVSQSSSAIEEMLANIESVTRISRTNSENVSRLAEASAVGRTGLQTVAVDMEEIARESESLLEIIAVLANIASQTNLLSMNAAIEAAHAGEAGRGFAVVADEIRKLAESSGTQSKTIGTVLKKIRDSITKISEATREVLAKFEVIEQDVKTVSDHEEQIRNAMEEQSAGSRKILEALGELNEITRTVQSSSEEMQERSKEIIEEGKNLEKVTTKIIGGMNDMAYRAGEVNSSVRHVNSISRKNKSNIEILREAISHFVIGDKHYTWDDSMCIGIKKIDEQHKMLFNAVNDFIDAVEKGTAKGKLKKSLDFINQYTITHFADEEHIQKQYGYPDYENHRLMHEKFKQTALDLMKEWQNFGTSEILVKEFKRKVGDWLVTHVKGQDAKIGEYLRKSRH